MSYETLFRGKYLFTNCKTIGQMARAARKAAERLEKMEDAGIKLRKDDGPSQDHCFLTTRDPKVAKRFKMGEEEA